MKQPQDLIAELIKLLRTTQGSLIHIQHKKEAGNSFQRQTFEMTTLGSKVNQSTKVIIHRWWRDKK